MLSHEQLANRFICVAVDGILYGVENQNNGVEVGHTNARFDDLIETAKSYKDAAEEYKKMCIEHGLIVVPKTPEELQAEMMTEMMKTIKELTEKVEVLSRGHDESGKTGSGSSGAESRKNSRSRPKSTAVPEDGENQE